MTTDELIRKYAKEIERIIENGTQGDYTWEGLLASFARDLAANTKSPIDDLFPVQVLADMAKRWPKG